MKALKVKVLIEILKMLSKYMNDDYNVMIKIYYNKGTKSIRDYARFIKIEDNNIIITNIEDEEE